MTKSGMEMREMPEYHLGRAAGESGMTFPISLIPNLNTSENRAMTLGYLEGAIARHHALYDKPEIEQPFRRVDVLGEILIK